MKRRLRELFPNDDRIGSAIPMGALLNKYEALADRVRDLLSRGVVTVAESELERLKQDYLGERKP